MFLSVTVKTVPCGLRPWVCACTQSVGALNCGILPEEVKWRSGDGVSGARV